MLREAKSLRCLSITTLRGGLPGIGWYGSITYIWIRDKLAADFEWSFNSYLWVDISDALAFFRVVARVNCIVTIKVLSYNAVDQSCGHGGV